MLAVDPKPKKLVGHAKPRLAPPTPARSLVADYEATAKAIGIDLMPWQKTSGRYLEAVDAKGRHLYQEVAILASRQNGKTTEMRPLIVGRLRKGRRMMHTAQNRELPREIFHLVVEDMEAHFRSEIKGRPRFANGQEEIRTRNGGIYRIVAPTRGGARGHPNDDVLVDEVRELENYDFIAAAKPTMTASPDPQIIYFSNAGSQDSEVLNDLRMRRDADPVLAYLEWSAEPGRDPGDRIGWQESNPALGHLPGVLDTLEREYRTAMLTGKMAVFETEHLCRWVISDDERVVSEQDWLDRQGVIGKPMRPYMAISLDPSGKRASAALAWQEGDHIALRIEADVTGSPIDAQLFAEALQARASRFNVRQIGYDDWTDKDLIRHLKNTRAIGGHEYAAASGKFDHIVRADQLIWDGADEITEDLRWLTRKAHESGAWQAVRVSEEHSVTAALAAIRAVWMASEPAPKMRAFVA